MNIGQKALCVWGAAAIIAVAGLTVSLAGCGDDPQPAAKNRVPTVAEQLTQAQDAAAQAKASADRANQTLKDIQAGIARLDNAGRNSDGSKKVGAPEVTQPGWVTSVGQSASHEGESTTVYTFYFTFAERTGFVKQFLPVCANQTVPVSGLITLNFHWKEYTSSTDKGCYMIDGYTVIK